MSDEISANDQIFIEKVVRQLNQVMGNHKELSQGNATKVCNLISNISASFFIHTLYSVFNCIIDQNASKVSALETWEVMKHNFIDECLHENIKRLNQLIISECSSLGNKNVH